MGDHRLMTTGQALIRYLQVQYSELDGERQRLVSGVFGIFGHGNATGIGDGLESAGTALPYYQARNEQSMVHAAIGFAKASRRRSLLACTSSIGPGATNMITGAATATLNHLPVLLLPGDSYANRRQGPVLQGLEHPLERDVSVNDAFRPVSRFFDRISRPEQLLASLPEAMRVLTDPVETGAVTIAIPQDVGPEAGEFPDRFFEPRTWRIERRQPDPAAIATAAEILGGAAMPLIIAGGGVRYSLAEEELLAFAEEFGVPVAETFAGKGSIAKASDMLLGGVGVEGSGAANEVARTADVVLCVGTRLGDFTTASNSLFETPEVRFVAINVSPRDAAKLRAHPVVGDAMLSLRALGAALRERGVRAPADRIATISRAREAWQKTLAAEVFIRRPDEALSQGELIDVMNRAARPGDVIVAAAGGPPGDLLKLWDATGDRACYIEFGNSCMGHEIPAAIGVRLAHDQGEILAYVGDGTYLLAPTEILTAIQEGAKITVVIAENHGFQVIWRLQRARTGRPFGNEFRRRDGATGLLSGPYVEVDLAKNAESLGARVWRVETVDELKRALEEARDEPRACVIVAKVETHRFLPGSGVWWDAAPPEVSDHAETRALRAEYESARRSQRFYG